MAKNCFVCKSSRSVDDMYFKHRDNFMCRHCLINGLTYEARFMFDQDSIESEIYFKKIGLISTDKNEDDWSERFAD